jgi:hypothetical protein
MQVARGIARRFKALADLCTAVAETDQEPFEGQPNPRGHLGLLARPTRVGDLLDASACRRAPERAPRLVAPSATKRRLGGMPPTPQTLPQCQY